MVTAWPDEPAGTRRWQTQLLADRRSPLDVRAAALKHPEVTKLYCSRCNASRARVFLTTVSEAPPNFITAVPAYWAPSPAKGILLVRFPQPFAPSALDEQFSAENAAARWRAGLALILHECSTRVRFGCQGRFPCDWQLRVPQLDRSAWVCCHIHAHIQ